jgi:hypothetical protein
MERKTPPRKLSFGNGVSPGRPDMNTPRNRILWWILEYAAHNDMDRIVQGNYVCDHLTEETENTGSVNYSDEISDVDM